MLRCSSCLTSNGRRSRHTPTRKMLRCWVTCPSTSLGTLRMCGPTRACSCWTTTRSLAWCAFPTHAHSTTTTTQLHPCLCDVTAEKRDGWGPLCHCYTCLLFVPKLAVALACVQVSGVPPDAFSETGQLWGTPLYDWEKHAAEDYSWWAERLARAFDLYDECRIDHFRAFAGCAPLPRPPPTPSPNCPALLCP